MVSVQNFGPRRLAPPEGVLTIRELHGVGAGEFAAMVAAGSRRPLPPATAFAESPVVATIETFRAQGIFWRSRWGAHCRLVYGAGQDALECAGYEDVDLEDQRFMCFSCWNAGVGGAWRRVIVPPKAERVEIEALLLQREDPRSRAFLPRGSVRGWEGADTLEAIREQNDLLIERRRAGYA